MRVLSRKERDGLLFLRQLWWRKKQLPLTSTYLVPPLFHIDCWSFNCKRSPTSALLNWGSRVVRWLAYGCRIHGEALTRTEVFTSRLLLFSTIITFMQITYICTEIYNLQTFFLYTSEMSTSAIVIYQLGSHRSVNELANCLGLGRRKDAIESTCFSW